MQVNRQEFIKALVAAKAIAPVVWVDGIESTDMRVEAHWGDGRTFRSMGARIRVDSDEKAPDDDTHFGAWVDAGKLIKILRGAKTQLVEVTAQGEAWQPCDGAIQLGIGGSSKLALTPANNPMEKDSPRGWRSPVKARPPRDQEVKMPGFLEMLNTVAYARAKKDKDGRGLTGVMLEIPADGGYTAGALASDGKRLAWTEWELRDTPPETCDWERVTLSGQMVDVVLKMGALTGGKGAGRVSVELNDDGLGLRVRVQLGPERWVVGEVGRGEVLEKGARKLIDQSRDGYGCTVDRAELLASLKALAPFARGIHKATEWGFEPGRLTLAAKDEEGNVGGRWLELDSGRPDLVTYLPVAQVQDYLRRVKGDRVRIWQAGPDRMARFELEFPEGGLASHAALVMPVIDTTKAGRRWAPKRP